MAPILKLTLTGLLLTGMAQEAGAGTQRSRPLKTGQTTCWNSAGTAIDCTGTGHDGDLRKGEPRRRVDPGDGTIRDKRTALTWEKLSDDGTIHDKDHTYTWAEAFQKIDDLNTAAFAGFSDWRLPNRFELETLLNLESIDPAVSDVFNSDCGANSGGNPGCTVTTCSCTVVGYYWTSSTCAGQTQSAWVVDFGGGGVYDGIGKVLGNSVRAVRSGS